MGVITLILYLKQFNISSGGSRNVQIKQEASYCLHTKHIPGPMSESIPYENI